MKRVWLSITSIFFIFLVWIIIEAVVNHPILAPSIKDIVMALGKILGSKSDNLSILFSFLRVVIVLVICFISGILMAFLAYKIPNVEIFLHPLVSIIRALPTVCIVVILSAIFGLWWSPYIITFMLLFPLSYQGALGSLKNIDIRYIYLYRLDSSNILRGVFRVYLPLIKANLLTTFVQCAGLSIKVMIMSEYLVQSTNSIGGLLYFAKVNLDYAKVIAITVILIILSLLVEFIPYLINKINLAIKFKKNNLLEK